MTQKYIVVNTKDSEEFKRLTPAIIQLAKIAPVLFTRVGQDAKLLTRQLAEDIDRYLLLSNFGRILPLTNVSLKTELKNKNIGMSMFVGSSPDIYNKKPNRIQGNQFINYRYASVCTKCESIIQEYTNQLKSEEVNKRLEGHRLHPDTREIINDNNGGVSVIISEDKCHWGCA